MMKLIEKPSPRNLTASQRVSRKYRREQRRKLQRTEYKKLKAIVPRLAKKGKVEKIEVIEEAIKYIDELHFALLDRLQMLPQGANRSFLGQIAPEAIVQHITGINQTSRVMPFNLTNGLHQQKMTMSCNKLQQLKANNSTTRWES